MLAAIRTYGCTRGASPAAVADDLGTIFAKLTVITEVTLAAGTVTADAAVGAQFIRYAVCAFFATLFADFGAVRAAVPAVAQRFHTVDTETAFGTVVPSGTVKAAFAITAELIVGTVFAFLAAIRADNGAVRAAVSAVAQCFHTVDTETALGAKVAAGTVKTALAVGANLIVRAVFAFFAASYTDYGAFRASVAAVADLIHTVFAQPAVGAVVTITADALKADVALGAKLALRAVCALFAAVRAYIGAFRASVAAGTNIFNAHFAQAAVTAVIPITAAAFEANLTVAAELIIAAVFAYCIAFGAEDGAFRTAFTASDTDLVHAEFTKITVQTVVAVAADTVIAGSAVFANAAVRTFLAFLAAGFTDQDTLGTAPAAFTYVVRTEFTKLTFLTVVALAAQTGEASSAVGTKLILGAACALFIAFRAALGAVGAALTAVAYPVRASDTQHAVGAVQLVARAFGTDAAVVADEINALRTFFTAHVADVAACRIASAAFFVALAAVLKTVAAVVAQLVVLLAGTAVAAVMLLVAVAVRALTAVIAVVAFPVVITPAAAVVALHAILVSGMHGRRKQ